MAFLDVSVSHGLGVVLAVAVMVGLSFGLLALGAAAIVTPALYFGASAIGTDLARQPLWLLLCLGVATAGALVAGGRLWLPTEVDWRMLWLAMPAGLAGAAAFSLSVRSPKRLSTRTTV